MKRMMSRREIEITERIDELTDVLNFSQEYLEETESVLLGYEEDYKESKDESLLPYIQLFRLEVEHFSAEVLSLQTEIEELEEEAKTA